MFFVKSNAKINLCLNVLAKKKKLHVIQSLFCFTSLHDEIFIYPRKKPNHKIIFTGKFSKDIPKKNTIIKTLEILDKEKLLKQKYLIIIKKNIPQMSGMGGGSMNSASLLKCFIQNKVFSVKRNKLVRICDLIGDDVKIGLEENLVFLDKKLLLKNFKKKLKFHLILFMPRKGCSSRCVYSKVNKFSKPYSNISNIVDNLKNLKNDLQNIVINEYPSLKKPIKYIKTTKGLKFIRMTGSGSCFVAYFKSKKDCINAHKKFIKIYRNYWSVLSKTV